MFIKSFTSIEGEEYLNSFSMLSSETNKFRNKCEEPCTKLLIGCPETNLYN